MKTPSTALIAALALFSLLASHAVCDEESRPPASGKTPVAQDWPPTPVELCDLDFSDKEIQDIQKRMSGRYQDDLCGLLNEGILGVNGKGLVEILPDATSRQEAERKKLTETVVAEENKDRTRLLERLVEVNRERLSDDFAGFIDHAEGFIQDMYAEAFLHRVLPGWHVQASRQPRTWFVVPSDEFEAVVELVWVVDGDTLDVHVLWVRDSHKHAEAYWCADCKQRLAANRKVAGDTHVRLAGGINAPEQAAPGGNNARDFVCQLLPKETVLYLKLDDGVRGCKGHENGPPHPLRDPFCRLVALVYFQQDGKALDVGRELLQWGAKNAAVCPAHDWLKYAHIRSEFKNEYK